MSNPLNEEYVDTKGNIYSNFRISKILKFGDHSGEVNVSLFFPPNLLVSASEDQKIMAFDLETCKMIQEIRDNTSYVRSLIRFSENTFYSGSCDYSICGYRIQKKSNKIVRMFKQKGEYMICQLLKLDDEHILVMVLSRELQIVNVKTKRLKKLLGTKDLLPNDWSSRMCLSKINPKVVFFSTYKYYQDENRCRDVKSINYDTAKQVQLFNKHKGLIFAVETYLSPKSAKEILIVAGDAKSMFFYDIATGNVQLELKTLDKGRSLLFWKPRFLVVGEFGGFLEIVYFHEEQNLAKVILSKKVHEKHSKTYDDVYSIELVEKNEKFLKVATSSLDHTIGLFSIGFDCQNYDIDEIERVEYLKEHYCEDFDLNIVGRSFRIGKILMSL